MNDLMIDIDYWISTDTGTSPVFARAKKLIKEQAAEIERLRSRDWVGGLLQWEGTPANAELKLAELCRIGGFVRYLSETRGDHFTAYIRRFPL